MKCPVHHPEMQMSRRTAKLISAIFAGLLAGACLTTASNEAAHAADECVPGPKGVPPAGGHWYYRVDRATKRHCWYVGNHGTKVSRLVTRNPAPSAPPPSDQADAAVQLSIADARAELPTRSTAQPPNRDDTPAAAVPPAAAQPQSSIVASRWPGSESVSPSTNPASAAHEAGVSTKSTAQTQPTPILAAESLVTADASSETSTYSVPIQLAALIGALALAAIVGMVIFKFGNSRRRPQGKTRARRGEIWESANTGDRTRQRYAEAEARTRPPAFSRAFDPTGERDDRIAKFFAQLSRRTPA